MSFVVLILCEAMWGYRRSWDSRCTAWGSITYTSGVSMRTTESDQRSIERNDTRHVTHCILRSFREERMLSRITWYISYSFACPITMYIWHRFCSLFEYPEWIHQIIRSTNREKSDNCGPLHVLHVCTGIFPEAKRCK